VKARAIVVLSGAMPLRPSKRRTLSRRVRAGNLAYSFRGAGETLEEMGIPFAGEDYYDTAF